MHLTGEDIFAEFKGRNLSYSADSQALCAMRVSRIQGEIKKYGIGITALQMMRSIGFIPASVIYSAKEKKYYSKLTKDEQIADLQELYYFCGLNDDIMHPSTFTGKIQWMKFHEDLNVRARLSDKYAVRQWIKDKIGEQYLIPSLGVWDSVEEIPFDTLPQQVVLKANHGSGMNCIIKDKNSTDLDKVKKKLNQWLHTSHGWNGMELQYFLIKRKIVAEEYISQLDGNLFDYKVHCFHGKPEFLQVIGDRIPGKHAGRQANYDFNWNRLPWTFEDYPLFDFELPRPVCLDDIYIVSKILSENFRYVRVDLYVIGDSIKFGEMTFTPGNGMYPYKGTWTKELDEKYGSMIKIEDLSEK